MQSAVGSAIHASLSLSLTPKAKATEYKGHSSHSQKLEAVLWSTVILYTPPTSHFLRSNMRKHVSREPHIIF